jgi:3-hydroxy-9,10-secoandrosta-1,3,5(10)-triene-9,17-dione monooxygenase reductase component
MEQALAADAGSPGSVIDPGVYRRACASFITGVAIVSGRNGGVPVGLTVNSFTSVSIDPPLVLFCVHRESQILAALREGQPFVVNILAEHQDALCRAFAKRETRRFLDVRHHVGVTGAPILSEALAYIEGRVAREIDGGDHLILLGEVLGLGVLTDSMPLAFFRSANTRVGGGRADDPR